MSLNAAMHARVGAAWRTSRLRVLRAAAGSRQIVVAAALTLIVVLVAFIGPALAPHSPTTFVTTPFASPSGAAPLGGDVLGRDVLSRTLDGGMTLIIMAAIAAIIGVGIGAAIGIAAAYLRGLTDAVLMRSVDVILAFPQLILALLFVSIIGPKLWIITLTVGVGHLPQTARVMRSAVLSVSEQDFVHAAELNGISSKRIMRREILPNVMSPLMVELGLRMTFSVVIIAGLAFLGFGRQPPAAGWGIMINENRLGLTANLWATFVPAMLIVALTIGVNLLTDGVAKSVLGLGRGRRGVLDTGFATSTTLDELVVSSGLDSR